ncbi:hypothetical protein ACFRQM_50605 [Streptomyces sp. NPDC056831]|uniref:hypothetical protein n=1 Tax=Streptomyces sp. NPDC056831 TaxID=3345954 RepID=UPI0036774456
MADDPTAAGAQIPARIHAVVPGWRQLLDGLHEQIRATFPDYRLLDLKEKLGGLRVYLEGPPGSGDTLRSLTTPAEAEAERTCEFADHPAVSALAMTGREDSASGVWYLPHSAWSAHRIMIIQGVVRGRG